MDQVELLVENETTLVQQHRPRPSNRGSTDSSVCEVLDYLDLYY